MQPDDLLAQSQAYLDEGERVAASNRELIKTIQDPKARARFAKLNEERIAQLRLDHQRALAIADRAKVTDANAALMAGIQATLDLRHQHNVARRERCQLSLNDVAYLMEIEAAFRKDLTTV